MTTSVISNSPSSGRSVSKQDAALRQINEAIRMMFEQRDCIAVHTLAAAATEVLDDIAEDRKIASIRRNNSDITNSVWKAATAPENFFKHARKDPDGVLFFDPRLTAFVLFDAVLITFRLGLPPTAERLVFAVWFFKNYPGVLDENTTPDDFLVPFSTLIKQRHDFSDTAMRKWIDSIASMPALAKV